MKKMRFRGSLRTRLQLNYLFIISVSLLTILLLTNYFYGQSIDSQANEYTSQMIAQVRANVDITIDSVDSVIKYLAKDETVLDYLRIQDQNSEERIDLETDVRAQMQIFYKERKELNGIVIASKNGFYASNQMSKLARDPITADKWYAQAAAKNGSLTITTPIGRNISIWQNMGTNDVVMLSRAVLDPETGEILGVIGLDVYISVLQDIINNVTLGKTGYILIMDEQGGVICGPRNDTVYRLRPQWFDAGKEINIHEIQGEPYQLLHSKSEFTGWIVGGVFAYGEMLEPMSNVRLASMLVLFATLAFAFFLATQFADLFTKPISELRALMYQAENGNLDVRFKGQHVGEIAQLGAGFNAMIDNIQTLLQLVYEEQQAKRDAELKTMQAQIKPHFLYNTLDTIRWMAVENGAQDVTELVSALTKLFRISLSRGADEISMSEELEHVRCYLYIQKVRYEEKLSFEVFCEEELLCCYVKKLILQPLVENAIYHGIKQKRGNGRIEVRVTRESDHILMLVADDGVGMSDSHIEKLNSLLGSDAPVEGEHGFGVFNVNDRIRLAYGAGFGLRFSRNEWGGVTAAITHPIIWEKDGGHNGIKDIDSR